MLEKMTKKEIKVVDGKIFIVFLTLTCVILIGAGLTHCSSDLLQRYGTGNNVSAEANWVLDWSYILSITALIMYLLAVLLIVVGFWIGSCSMFFECLHIH